MQDKTETVTEKIQQRFTEAYENVLRKFYETNGELAVPDVSIKSVMNDDGSMTITLTAKAIGIRV